MRGLATTNSSSLSAPLYGLLSWLVPLALSLAVTPYIVEGLQYESYGLYSLVIGFVAFSLNLNYSKALTRAIADARGKGEAERLPGLITTGFLLAIVLGVMAVFIVTLTADLYVGSVLRDASHRAETVMGLWIGSLIIFALLLNQVFSSVVQGFEAFKMVALVAGAVSTLTLVSNLVLVKSGFGFVVVLLGTFSITALGVSLNALCAKVLVKGPLFGKVDLRLVGPILGYSKYVIGYQMLGSLLLLIERSAISSRLGPEALTFYVVPMTICLQFNGLVNSASLFILPKISRQSQASGKNLILYRVATRMVLLICVLALSVTYLQGDQFLKLWMGEGFVKASGDSFFLLMIGFACLSLAVVSANVAEGLGRPSVNFWVTVGIVIVTSALIFEPPPELGIDAYASARAQGFAVCLLGIPLIERLAFGRLQISFWLEAGVKALSGAAVFALVIWFLGGYLKEGWMGMILSAILGGSVAILLLWKLSYFKEAGEILASERFG